jgi:hypothetical protein
MADNVTVTPGSGATVSADDVGGVLYQRIKIDAGGDGVAVPVVAGQRARAASLPVVLATEDLAALASQATLAQVLAALASVAVTGPLTDTQLRATAVPVSGSITVGAAIPAGTNNIGDVDVLTLPSVNLSADAIQGQLGSIEITLSGTPGTVTTFTFPDTAQGFNLYPRSNPARFAIGEDPAAVATSSSTSIAAAALAVGGIAKADQWTTRLIAAGTSRTLRLRSLTASLVIDLEVF